MSDALLFRTYKLEDKYMKFTKVDFKLLGTIMRTAYPMNFVAEDITIIDYQNINEGFRFETSCNYEGATIHGEIIFDNIKFASESEILDKLKSGSFIYSISPANFTIKNSAFKMHHRSMENFDVFKFEDSGL